MSVEVLLGSRAGKIMAEIKSAEEKSGYKRSPVYLSATAFWRYGREGLRETTEALKRNEIKFDSENGFLSDLPDEYKQSAYLNFAACIFGVTMIFNERALIEKEIDLRQVTVAYNWVFYDTFVPQLEQPEEEVEKLSDKQHADLLKLVDLKHPDTANRSLSRLYFDKMGLMPKAIKRVLEDTNTLLLTRDVFLPRHEWLVTQLISSNARQMAGTYQ